MSGCAHSVENGVVRLEFHGSVSVGDVLEVRTAVQADTTFEPGMPILADMRNASVSSLSMSDIRKLVEDGRIRTRDWPPFKLAAVVSRQVDFGLWRL